MLGMTEASYQTETGKTAQAEHSHATASMRLHWCIFAGLALLLGALAIHIQNYVLPKDPQLIYLAHARSLVETDWALNSFKTFRLAPGYPALLAGMIELFGTYAPAWTNLLFGWLYVWLLLVLVRRLSGSMHCAFWSCIGLLFILLAGYHHNAHYFIYLFRDMPAQCLLLLSMVLVTGKRCRPLLACIALLAATSIREIALAGAIVPLAWLLLQPSTPGKQRVKNCGWFLTPFLLGGLALFTLELLFKTGLSSQFTRFLGILNQLHFSSLNTLAHSIHQQVGFLGWGLILFACGWNIYKQRGWLLLFFLIPAAITFLLYANYRLHYRYAFTVLLWLAPLMGIGLADLLERIHPLMRGRRWLLLPGLCLIPMAYWVTQASPWMHAVKAEDVSTFRKDMHHVLKSGDALVAEYDANLGMAAALSYTRAQSLNIAWLHQYLKADGTAYYFKARDVFSQYDSPGNRDQGSLISQRITDRYDLTPIPSRDGKGDHICRLGTASFQLFRIEKRQASEITQRFPAVRIGNAGASTTNATSTNHNHNLILCNFHEATEVTVELEGQSFDKLDGIQILRVPIPKPGEQFDLTARSIHPGLAREVAYAVVAENQPLTIPFGKYRSATTHDLVSKNMRLGSTHLYAATLWSEGEITLPIPLGQRPKRMTVGIDLLTIKPHPGMGRLHIRYAGKVLRSIDFDPSLNALPIELTIDLPETGTKVRLEFEIDESDPPNGFFLRNLNLHFSD